MRRAAVTGLAALVLLCGVLLFVPRLRDARLTLGAVLARFGVLVGMESEEGLWRLFMSRRSGWTSAKDVGGYSRT